MKIKIKKVLSSSLKLNTNSYYTKIIYEISKKYPYMCSIMVTNYKLSKTSEDYHTGFNYRINSNHIVCVQNSGLYINTVNIPFNTLYCFKNETELENFQKLIFKIFLGIKNNSLEKINNYSAKELKIIKPKFKLVIDLISEYQHVYPNRYQRSGRIYHSNRDNNYIHHERRWDGQDHSHLTDTESEANELIKKYLKKDIWYIIGSVLIGFLLSFFIFIQ